MLLRCPYNIYVKIKYPDHYVTLNFRQNWVKNEWETSQRSLGIGVEDLGQSPKASPFSGEENLSSQKTKKEQQKGPKESMVSLNPEKSV